MLLAAWSGKKACKTMRGECVGVVFFIGICLCISRALSSKWHPVVRERQPRGDIRHSGAEHVGSGVNGGVDGEEEGGTGACGHL